jgi:carbon-monoxide dehydrogenase large subunit
MVSAFDIGRAINPDLVKGQIYGAVVQGIGVALMEQYICDEKGVLVNDNLADYKIARISDIPEEHIPIMIQTPQEDGPYGARGIGELALIGVPSAIGNAVCDAIGVEMMDLPITSERIWEALVRKGK